MRVLVIGESLSTQHSMYLEPPMLLFWGHGGRSLKCLWITNYYNLPFFHCPCQCHYWLLRPIKTLIASYPYTPGEGWPRSDAQGRNFRMLDRRWDGSSGSQTIPIQPNPLRAANSLMPLRAPITFNESLLPLFPRKSKPMWEKSKPINRTVIVLSDLAGLVSPKKNISSFISSSFHAGHKY